MVTPIKARLVFLFLISSVILSGCNWLARVNVSATGGQADAAASRPYISGDGRYIFFSSAASNLLPDTDTNHATDIFRKELATNTLEIVSRAHDGSLLTEGGWGSSALSASKDGRYVTFITSSDAVLPTPLGEGGKLVMRDIASGANTVINLTPDGDLSDGSLRSAVVSDDGNFVFFMCSSCDVAPNVGKGIWHVYLRDVQAGTTELISKAPNDVAGYDFSGTWSYEYLTMTGDARFLVFKSSSYNLVPADYNHVSDYFVHDRLTGTTTLETVATDGTQSDQWSYYATISEDGRYLLFESASGTLVPGDDNGEMDIFLRDRLLGTTTLIERIDDAPGSHYYSSISADGRYVAYTVGGNPFPKDGEMSGARLFVYDRQTGFHQPVDRRRPDVAQFQSGGSVATRISDDNRYIIWLDSAHDIVLQDNNVARDIFVRALTEIRFDSISPSHVPAGATTNVTFSGFNFKQGATPGISGPGLTISNVQHIDETTITMDLTITADTSSGARTSFVWLYGTGASAGSGAGGNCVNCLTIL